jgi:hypothetical protein
VKARRVRGLDPDGPFRIDAARLVRVRLDELCSFDPAIRDAANVVELHDMRIAGKRLRYVLEIVGFAFGEEARDAERETRWLQDVLGEVHDCDVMIPLVAAAVADLRRADRAVLLAAAEPFDERSLGRLQAAVGAVPGRTRYRGLETLGAYLEARRELLYRQFLDRWDTLISERWRERLEAALE